MNYYNYTSQFPAIKKAKIEQILAKQYRHNHYKFNVDTRCFDIDRSEVLTRAEFIVKRIIAGAELSSNTEGNKTDYYISNEPIPTEDEPFRTNCIITKSEYDFASWLINNWITTVEAAEVLKQAENERISKAIAEAEAKEKADREAAEKAVQENSKFILWLTKEAENYKDEQKLEILKQTFLQYTGYVPGKMSVKLLVLIDNFDNSKCKDELISWLHSGNKASKKAFEIITGIKLHDTDKKTREILNGVSSKDFNFSNIPIKINFCKPAEETTKEVFYILNNNREFEEVLAEPLQKYGLNMFIQKVMDQYKISEAKTGLLIAKGKTKAEAVDNLKLLVDKMTIEKINSYIDDTIKKYGISPKYQDRREAV